ncbi:MAG: type II secretion system protein [Rhodospirillales bacterium]|nr:type II secretion system protein [Rhodospirillales bacterium]
MRRAYKTGTESGFTLLELAIVIIVSGLLLTAAMQVYKSSLSNGDYRLTNDNVELAQEAIEEYYGLKGRYPCPANPALRPGDIGYGVELCPPANIVDCSTAPVGIVCTSDGSRDADGQGGDDPILIGTLPIVTLAGNPSKRSKIEEINGRDGYGMKFTYAVSGLMADTAYTVDSPANPHLGGINLRDENDQSLTDIEASTHFVVISHGFDQVGATPYEGTAVLDACQSNTFTPIIPGTFEPGTGVAKTDRENCDNDAYFVAGLRRLADNDNYFDDIIYYTTTASMPLWMTSNFSPPGQTWIYNTNLGNVGVGDITPTTPLQAVGDIRIEDRVESEQGFCNYLGVPGYASSTGCLQPSFISGDVGAGTGGYKCPDGKVAKGIENNQLVCEDLLPGGAGTHINFSNTCSLGPPQEFVTGIVVRSDGTGDLICSTYP